MTATNGHRAMMCHDPTTPRTMSLGRLAPLLRPLVADVDARWEAWRASHTDDPLRFAQHLVDEGLIEAEMLADLETSPGDPPGAAKTTFPTHWEDGTEVEVGSTERKPGPAHDVPGRGWTLEDTVGSGAMGSVLRAQDRDLNREVAYKVMSPRIAARPDLAARFYCEAQITGQLDHPNVPPIYSLARDPDGRLAYTMKLVDGVNLEQAIRAAAHEIEQGLPPNDAHSLQGFLDVFLKVCDAVHYAHHCGIVHRDLKPENLMMGGHGEVYVMDWGIAGIMADLAWSRPKVEGFAARDTLGSGRPNTQLVGTPGFMSPEQAQGAADIDGRSDVFALGLILQEMLTLKPAVTGTGIQQVARNQLGDREPPIHRFGAYLPKELLAVVDKACAPERDERYASAGELADDVRRYLRGDAVLARPDTPWMALLRWVGRHRAGVTVAGLVLCCVAIVLVSGLQVQRLWERAAAQQHEQALAAAVANTAQHAAAIDARLLRYEGLLEGLSSAAFEVLEAPAQDRPLFWAADFDAGQVPGLAESPYYRAPVSVDHAALLAPSGTSENADRLVRLHRALQRAVLQSGESEGSAWERIAVQGQPLSWVSVALESGLLTTFPGHGGFPDGYDPRQRPWYRLGADAERATWGAPYVDSGGLGLLLPCSAPLRADGELVGVASIKLSLDKMIGDLLEVPGAHAVIVDADGRVVVDAQDIGLHQGQSELRNDPMERALYPVEGVVETIRDGRSGSVWVSDEVVLFHQLGVLGWWYVVRGEAALLVP